MYIYQGHKILKKPFYLLSLSLISLLFCINTEARDLQSILRDGSQNDPGIKEAEANERVAAGRLAQSEAAKWPTVVARANQPVIRSDNSGGHSLEPVLEAKWTIYDFGKRDAQIQHDEAKIQYFTHKTKETEQEFLYELAGHYLEALRAKMLLTVAHNNLKRHQEILRKLRIIVEYDPGRRSEMTQAEARLLQVRENILNHQRLQSLALSRLNRYISPPVRSEELSDPFIHLDINRLKINYPVNEASLRQNPSYQAQARELDSVKVEAKSAELSRWPDINLLGEAKRHDSAIYLSISFDVFDRSISPEIDEKRYQAEAANARLQKIIYNLQERAELAALEMQEDQLRIDIATSQIKTLSQVARDYEDQFEIAQRSLLDVLNAYNELASIEQLQVQARYDLMSAKLDYLSAAGKISHWAGIESAHQESIPQVIIAGVNDMATTPTDDQLIKVITNSNYYFGH